jgi:hypothetical protein
MGPSNKEAAMLTRHPQPPDRVTPADELAEPAESVEPVGHPSTFDWPNTRDWLMERVDGRVGIAVGVAWLVLTEIAFALEPAPQKSEPLIGVLLAVAMNILIITMITGMAFRKRWGFAASLAAAGFATVASIACPISGHHQFGNWWYGQMACCFALVAISVAALRHDYRYLESSDT